jgi:hypothetical protein
MRKLTALLVATLFALGLSSHAFAGEPKKDEPAAKEAATMKNDNTVEKETKAGKEGKKDDAKPKKKKKEAAGC